MPYLGPSTDDVGRRHPAIVATKTISDFTALRRDLQASAAAVRVPVSV
ncbi:MAG: hypothetical protein M3O32_07370 [Actinomycetota bacterium]|nr:hypothetical protein [Actinomycetota bacterium]